MLFGHEPEFFTMLFVLCFYTKTNCVFSVALLTKKLLLLEMSVKKKTKQFSKNEITLML